MRGFKFFLLFKIDNSQGKIGDQRLRETEKMSRCRKCEVAWCSWEASACGEHGENWSGWSEKTPLLLSSLTQIWYHSAGWKICKCDSFCTSKTSQWLYIALSINPKFLVSTNPCLSDINVYTDHLEIFSKYWFWFGVSHGARFCSDDKHAGGMSHWSSDDICVARTYRPTNFKIRSSFTLKARFLTFFKVIMLPLDSSLWKCSFFFIQNFSPLVSFFPNPSSHATPLIFISRIYPQTPPKASTFPSQHFTQFVFILKLYDYLVSICLFLLDSRRLNLIKTKNCTSQSSSSFMGQSQG